MSCHRPLVDAGDAIASFRIYLPSNQSKFHYGFIDDWIHDAIPEPEGVEAAPELGLSNMVVPGVN